MTIHHYDLIANIDQTLEGFPIAVVEFLALVRNHDSGELHAAAFPLMTS